MAILLKRAGYQRITLYEKSGGVGGTWRDNSYPGAACDVPSRLYSFSFAPNPDWSHVFSGAAEINAYLERCASDFGLRPHLRLNTEVTAAHWQDDRKVWRLTLADGTTDETDVLVSALGQLNRPQIPAIDGLDSFAGPSFHSARWRHDVELGNKAVAVIGTGASAVQFIPQIARQVRQLTVFQRSPNWIITRNDRPYAAWEKRLFRAAPWLDKAMRYAIYWFMEQRIGVFKLGSKRADSFTLMALRHLFAQVKDPKLRKALTPDYAIGCKRILIADDYFPTFNRPNVTLETTGIARIHPDGVETADGRRVSADVLIFGTGFATTDMLQPLEIVGAGGVRLHQQWQEGAEAYLGVSVTNVPNFFMLYGPNTNLGHNSIIFMMEAQMRYIIQALNALLGQGAPALDVRADTQSTYNAELQQQMRANAFSADCGSWYKTASGKIVNNWPGSSIGYWLRMRRFNPAAYRFLARSEP